MSKERPSSESPASVNRTAPPRDPHPLAATESWFRKHLAAREHVYVILAVWAAHTHAIEKFSTTPYLHITSAAPESGKSRLLELLRMVCRDADIVADISTAAL